MKANEAAFPVAAMCRVLDLAPSGYYGWLKRPRSARARRDAELKDRITVIWTDSGEIYGCPRIHAALLAEGEQVGRKRVARLMRELGIEGVTRRRFNTATTKKDAKARPAPDLVDRDFSAGGPNRLWWPTSRTCPPGRAGWLYLAVVLDAWSRRIVGWAMDSHMRAELVEDALAMALSRRQPKGGVVHHSDKGLAVHVAGLRGALPESGDRPVDGLCGRRVRQRDVRELLRNAGVRVESTGSAFGRPPRRGGKSSFSSRASTTPARLHSALGYESPVRYEKKHHAA